MRSVLIPSMLTLLGGLVMTTADAADRPLRLSWAKNILTVEGDHLPGKKVEIWYLEAYCRDGSTDRVWGETTIGHKTELVSISKDHLEVILRCTLNDGVTVDHTIRTGNDAVSFELTAHNPTKVASRALGATLRAGRCIYRPHTKNVSRQVVRVPRRQIGSVAHSALGHKSPLCSGASLGPQRGESQRCQSAAAQRRHSQQRPHRLLFRR